MLRSAFALGLVLATAGVALADIPPPPPPKGYKYISVENELVVAKDVTGYVFVEIVSNFLPAAETTGTKLVPKDGKPLALSAGGRRSFVRVYAVPADAAKGYAKDEELFAALEKNKVEGAHAIAFTGTATVPDSIKGARIVAAVTRRIREKEILKKMSHKLPPIAMPKQFIVIPELPKLGSGKIDFRTATDLARDKVKAGKK